MTEISQNLSITILVTGASGFIGRQLIETLSQSASKYKIIALVRDSNQFESSFDVIEGNINDAFLQKYLDGENSKYISKKRNPNLFVQIFHEIIKQLMSLYHKIW